MVTATADHDIRSLTVQALRDAGPSFDEFDRQIDQCCTAFEDGKDDRGQAVLACLANPLGEFAGFCRAIMGNCGHELPTSTAERMFAAGRRFEGALQAILGEVEEQNFIGVGDACRFDLAEALRDCRQLFPVMAEQLERT